MYKEPANIDSAKGVVSIFSHQYVTDTITILSAEQEINPRSLATKLNIEGVDASKVLRKLYRFGIVNRAPKGREGWFRLNKSKLNEIEKAIEYLGRLTP